MLGHGFVFKSDEAKPAAGAGCGLLYNLDVLHKPILAEKPTQLFLSQVVINATDKHLVPRATTLAAATLRLLLLALVATLTIVPVARGPISATTAAASAATLSPIRLTWLFNGAFRRLRNQKTIRGLVAIALSYLDIPAANRVAVLLEHDAIQPIAHCLVVAVNLESNKRKAARTTRILLAHDGNVHNLAEIFHVPLYIGLPCRIQDAANKVLHEVGTEGHRFERTTRRLLLLNDAGQVLL